MSRDFVISTDTTCDLPEDFLRENDIDIHPLYYAFGSEEYGDKNVLSDQEFYARVRAGEMPTSMACNVETSKRLFQARLEQGVDVLHIGFSSALSSSCPNAQAAAGELKEEHPDANIVVVDSLAASMGEGLLVYYAVQLKKEGKSLEEVAAWLEENKLHLSHQFTVGSLVHLFRGGRVSRATAIVGTLAGIKPMLHVDDEGRLIPVGKVRGRKNSLLGLVDAMEKSMGSYRDKNKIIFISHGDCEQDAQFVADEIRRRFGFDKFWIHYVCPTIGSHSGPDTVALFFLADKR